MANSKKKPIQVAVCLGYSHTFCHRLVSVSACLLFTTILLSFRDMKSGFMVFWLFFFLLLVHSLLYQIHPMPCRFVFRNNFVLFSFHLNIFWKVGFDGAKRFSQCVQKANTVLKLEISFFPISTSFIPLSFHLYYLIRFAVEPVIHLMNY